jgi:hypothetical protein
MGEGGVDRGLGAAGGRGWAREEDTWGGVKRGVAVGGVREVVCEELEGRFTREHGNGGRRARARGESGAAETGHGGVVARRAEREAPPLLPAVGEATTHACAERRPAMDRGGRGADVHPGAPGHRRW